MLLNLATDYAIRALLELGRNGGGIVSVTELGERTGVSSSYLHFIIGKLRRSGYVGTLSGKLGGVYLKTPPERISLLDVVRAIEGGPKLNRVVHDAGNCADTTDSVRRSYCVLQNMVETYLGNVTIADLINEPSGGGGNMKLSAGMD